MSSNWDGSERRDVVSQDEQLGYIRGKVEGVQSELTDFKDDMKTMMKDHIEKEEEDRAEFLAAINKLTMELTIYKRVFKGLIATIITGLTITFGDLFKWLGGK